MTGYGKSEALLENGKLTIEIRTLNGKSADISIKSPLLPKDKELEVRRRIASRLVRGTIDMFITWEPNRVCSGKKINQDLVVEYYNQMREIAALCDGSAFNLAAVLQLPGLVDESRQEVITEQNWPLVSEAIDRALDATDLYRSQEGKILVADVTSKVENILSASREIETYEKERTEAIRERILSKFEELSLEVDPQRLEQEMIFYLEKLDINEERVRLRQHCAYFLETLNNDPLPGRKLGFIAQEMGREINTTGSKANHGQMQKLVTMMKDELEKIKEQSLNIL